MRGIKLEVSFYEDDKGVQPAKEFILTLPLKMRAKISRIITLLEENGNQLRAPYSKHLTDGIFELRAQAGSDISRVLYFYIVGNKAILTHGFIKKTQKTPASEIEKAKQYRKAHAANMRREQIK